MMHPILEVNDLTVSFPHPDGDHTVVHAMSYQIHPGEIVAMVGESGSGKSVAAMAVAGLLPSSAHVRGSVRLKGQELLTLSDRQFSQIRGRSLGVVFQDPMSALTPVYSIGDQLIEALKIHHPHIPYSQLHQRAQLLLDQVGIHDPVQRMSAFPHELSGGERQRVVIAMAISCQPNVLICDEPTTALDVTIQAQILEILSQARTQMGVAILMITHDLGVVADFADRALVVYCGHIVESAPVAQLYHHRQMPYTAGLLAASPRLDAPQGTHLVPIPGSPPKYDHGPGCAFSPRCPLASTQCIQASPPLEFINATHQVACWHHEDLDQRSAEEIYGISFPPLPTSLLDHDRPIVLEVRNLTKTYRKTTGWWRPTTTTIHAVSQVSFCLHQGSTVAIVGESGSGKTTTLHQILPLIAPEEGQIRLLGHDVATLTSTQRRQLRHHIQLVFQDPSACLDPRLPIFDILAEPLRTTPIGHDQLNVRIKELLSKVGLSPEDARRYPHEFSGGQKQRIGIARALALQPTILALDEPVSALDVSIQAGIINLLLDLQNHDQLSYLFVSHDLAVVKHLAHYILVMHQGHIVEQGPATQIFTDPQHPYTQRLLAAVPHLEPTGE